MSHEDHLSGSTRPAVRLARGDRGGWCFFLGPLKVRRRGRDFRPLFSERYGFRRWAEVGRIGFRVDVRGGFPRPAPRDKPMSDKLRLMWFSLGTAAGSLWASLMWAWLT